MTIKDMGRVKKSQKIIKCPNPKCKERLVVDELIRDGYLEKTANVTSIICPFCDEMWEER